MYSKPHLQRFGAFRELTLGGGTEFKDQATPLDDNDTCTPFITPKGTTGYTCLPSGSF
jgi:hypothetical protein